MNYNTELDKFLRGTRDIHTGAERDEITRRLLIDAFDAGYRAGSEITARTALDRLGKLIFG